MFGGAEIIPNEHTWQITEMERTFNTDEIVLASILCGT